MQSAKARELRILQPGYGAEDAHLFGMFQFGLEADHVPQRAEAVVLAQLHHGMGALAAARILQPHRLHGAESQGLLTTRCHHFDGQAGFEIGRGFFPFLEVGLFAGQQRGDEILILRLVQRQVDIVRYAAAGALLVITRLEPGDVEIDGLAVHDGGDGVEEGQMVLARGFADGRTKTRGGQRPGGDNHASPAGRRQGLDFLTRDRDAGMIFQRRGDGVRKSVPVHCQGAHNQGPGASHFLVQQADRVVHGIVGAEGVGANQLRQGIGLMGVGAANRTHLVENHRRAGFGCLPGRL